MVPASGPPVGWINISASGNYGYTPPYFQQEPTNATITVRFTDGSDLAHTFTIINKEGWVVPTSYSPAQIDTLAYGTPSSNLDNANVSGPGVVNVTTFTSPGPGWYEFVCTVSGHFQLGMYGFIAFGMNLPSNLTGSGRTGVGGHLTFNVVDAGIVVVLIAIIAGGYLYIQRRRQRARFPP
jgi:plastocyanin